MKNLFTLVLIILIFGTGCEEIEKLTQFEMEFNEAIVINSALPANTPLDIPTPAIKSNAESTFSNNGTSKDLVEIIKLTQMNLTLSSPSDSDLDFFKSIEIFISANGLSEKKIAWKDSVPANTGKKLELETTEADLKKFIMEDEFSLRLKVVTDEELDADHHVNMHSVFFVDAKI